jgi:uncharacterized protein (DUF1800 family)
MKKSISIKTLKRIDSDYSYMAKYIDEGKKLTVKQWSEKYRGIIFPSDIIILVLNNGSIPLKDLRRFALWCVNESLKLMDDPDPRIVEAYKVGKKYVNGQASKKELNAANKAAWEVTDKSDPITYNMYYATCCAISGNAVDAAESAHLYAASYLTFSRNANFKDICDSQLDHLLTYL